MLGKNWKQMKCLLFGEWMEKMWRVYTVGYYAAMIRRKPCLTHDLGHTMLGRSSQMQDCKA